MATWELAQRVLAAVLLLPCGALAVVLGLLIRLSSPGPILITQQREGRHGKSFSMYKLRTMVTDADALLEDHLARDENARREWGTFGRLANDPRIAGAVARAARRWSIDEVPQLLNVVLGDMNLVGPRPLPFSLLGSLHPASRILRQSVRPGLTGLWQVNGRSDVSLVGMGQIDRVYIRRRTICLDIAILLRTGVTVLRRQGAY